MPLGYGGLGIPSASAISEPAYLGSIASVWHTLLDLIPDLRDLDIASPDSDRLPSLRDARHIHTRLLAEHASLQLRYKTLSEDKSYSPRPSRGVKRARREIEDEIEKIKVRRP